MEFNLKTLSNQQLSNYAEWLRPRLLGAQLQEVWLHKDLVCFDCYLAGAFTFVVDLSPNLPGIYLVEELPLPKTPPKPVIAFLKSHARGKRINEVEHLIDKGRVLLLSIGPCEFEIELIPRSPNLSIRAETEKGIKTISWAKPKVRGQQPAEIDSASVSTDWQLFQQNWLERQFGASKNSKNLKGEGQAQAAQDKDPAEVAREKALQKKVKALEVMEKNLQEILSPEAAEEFRKKGQQLLLEIATTDRNSKAHKTLQLEAEEAFNQARQVERKRQGAIERIEVLKAEIEKLLHPENHRAAPAHQQGTRLSGKPESRPENRPETRQLKLESGAIAWIGKSAADNLKLLRQARAWDFWLHLKDSPSAYAIVRREKNQKIPQAELDKIGLWLLSQSRLAKKSHSAESDILVVECRHVRPIKGDKLGRVTYVNPHSVFKVRL